MKLQPEFDWFFESECHAHFSNLLNNFITILLRFNCNKMLTLLSKKLTQALIQESNKNSSLCAKYNLLNDKRY